MRLARRELMKRAKERARATAAKALISRYRQGASPKKKPWCGASGVANVSRARDARAPMGHAFRGLQGAEKRVGSQEMRLTRGWQAPGISRSSWGGAENLAPTPARNLELAAGGGWPQGPPVPGFTRALDRAPDRAAAARVVAPRASEERRGAEAQPRAFDRAPVGVGAAERAWLDRAERETYRAEVEKRASIWNRPAQGAVSGRREGENGWSNMGREQMEREDPARARRIIEAVRRKRANLEEWVEPLRRKRQAFEARPDRRGELERQMAGGGALAAMGITPTELNAISGANAPRGSERQGHGSQFRSGNREIDAALSALARAIANERATAVHEVMRDIARSGARS